MLEEIATSKALFGCSKLDNWIYLEDNIDLNSYKYHQNSLKKNENFNFRLMKLKFSPFKICFTFTSNQISPDRIQSNQFRVVFLFLVRE